MATDPRTALTALQHMLATLETPAAAAPWALARLRRRVQHGRTFWELHGPPLGTRWAELAQLGARVRPEVV